MLNLLKLPPLPGVAFVEALHVPADLRCFPEHRLRYFRRGPSCEAAMNRFYALVQAGPNPAALSDIPEIPLERNA